MDKKLIQFIEHAREKGMEYSTIRQLLLSMGWKDKNIAEVFTARDLDLPIPSPPAVNSDTVVRPRGRSASPWPRRARDAFLHLLMFGALYAATTSLILLFFTYMNFAFPDPAWRTSFAQLEMAFSLIRAQLAIVMVAFPIFLFLWHFLLRETRRNPDKVAMRRWLGYLSVFVGVLTLSGDTMTLIYYLLEGQLTLRFLLKAGLLFVISGGLVLYLILTLRNEMQEEALS